MKITKPLVLVSTSPQRKALLEQLGLSFTIVPHRLAVEEIGPGPVEEALAALALAKAQSVAEEYPASLLLGADTVIAFAGEILGKPSCYNEAFTMLRRMRGKVHEVVSGVALCDGERVQMRGVTTQVRMRAYSDLELHDYLSTGEYRGRAGSYAIQGRGVLLTEGICGSYTNVVGLPLEALGEMLRERG